MPLHFGVQGAVGSGCDGFKVRYYFLRKIVEFCMRCPSMRGGGVVCCITGCVGRIQYPYNQDSCDRAHEAFGVGMSFWNPFWRRISMRNALFALTIAAFALAPAFVSAGPNCSKNPKTASSKPGCCAKSGASKADASKSSGSKATVASDKASAPCAGKSGKKCDKAGKGCPKAGKDGSKADKGCPKAGAECCSKAGANCPKAGSDCCKAKLAAANVPLMRCVVGDEVTNCPMEAMKIAEKSGLTPEFYLDDTKYTDPKEAGKAYAARLESFLGEITTVKYVVGSESVGCPKTAGAMAKKAGTAMKYRLAAFDFDAQDDARAAAKRATEAAEKVTMATLVDGKANACPMTAKKAAADGKTVAYKIGENSVDCPIKASVMLNMAKVRAALTALEGTGEKTKPSA